MPPKLYPRLTLALLTGLNVLNYFDRSVLFGVQPLIQKEFLVNDVQLGALNSAFFLSYLCAAPFVGYLGDRYARRKIVAIGIIIWSGFTLLSGITHTYNELLFRHIMVGIGEASYAVIAPTLIADSFPIERRGRMLSIFNLALPLGTGLGIGLGGFLGAHLGWRAPFMMAGIPGFLLALVLWVLPEPERGKTDSLTVSEVRSTLPSLLRNAAFVSATLGLAMYTFALGGLQQWMPTFLVRVRNISLDKATLIFGVMTGAIAIAATLSGGWLGDRMLQNHRGAYYTLSGAAMLIAVPLMIVAIYMTGRPMYPAICVAEFFLLLNTGPLNAAIVNSVNAKIRSTALAVNVVVIHLLGDVPSPSIIGWISDKTSSLQKGFWVTFVAAALSGLILVYGSRFAPPLDRMRGWLLRHRERLDRMAAAHVQHMQKTLTQMNLHIHKVLTDITGKSGMAILDAILEGQRDPQTLAKLRDTQEEATEETIMKSLMGDYLREHVFTLRQSVQAYRYYQELMVSCDQEIKDL